MITALCSSSGAVCSRYVADKGATRSVWLRNMLRPCLLHVAVKPLVSCYLRRGLVTVVGGTVFPTRILRDFRILDHDERGDGVEVLLLAPHAVAVVLGVPGEVVAATVFLRFHLQVVGFGVGADQHGGTSGRIGIPVDFGLGLFQFGVRGECC